MTNPSQKHLDDLIRERSRLRRILDVLPQSQASQRPQIEQQLADTAAKIKELEGSVRRDENAAVDTSLSREEQEYLRYITDRFRKIVGIYSDISAEGMELRARSRLSPAAADFIALHHEVYSALSHSFEASRSRTVEVSTLSQLFDVIAEHPRVALIGDPGAGKSTTLTRLAFEYGSRAMESGRGLIPVFVDLSTCVAQQTLRSMITGAFGGHGITDVDVRGRTIMLFDGLNEAPLPVIDELSKWLSEDPALHAIVACRRLDYVERELPLRRIDIKPLSVVQIYGLISNFFEDDRDRGRLFWSLAGKETLLAWRWFQRESGEFATFDNFWSGEIGAAYSYEVEKSHIASLQRTLREDGTLPGVLGLVSNPFLLYLAIIIHISNGEPPSNRGQLFEEFAKIMLQRGGWTGSGVYDRTKAGDAEDDGDAGRILEDVAFEMISQGLGTGITEKWLNEFLLLKLDSRGAADRFLDRAKRSAILDWHGQTKGIVKFRHQLLQEYFAARRLRREIDAGALASKFFPSARWWERSAWDEVVMMLAGIDGDATRIVEWLTPTNPSLAFRCATEAGVPCSKAIMARLFAPETGVRVCPMARAQWGRDVAELGDPREGVGLTAEGIPDIVWCTVPEGEYHIGGDESLRGMGLYVERTPVRIPRPLLIAKYPVTCAQFEAFVLGGYAVDEYWTVTGLEWRRDQRAPRLWSDERFRIANHPVVGVTWFEAYAFTRWLNQQFHDAGWRSEALGAHWEVSLPTEAEWEAAARYPDERKFPWGDVYEPGVANIDETYQNAVCGPYSLRRTTAVGIYESGRSHLGLYDMCGNVWEWCLSRWDVEYRFPEDVSTEGIDHRAVRGGSWYNSVHCCPS